ncbi:glycoside hydrolase family 79 protein [Pseudocercospora fijiensis CIRAD86]|uniref:Glycoside hydrolase family 79 protein n=1 Tax=Pseudocercospora fijiensis (strain CIRAD86) TaxID=383855 RepID=M3ACA0_PSEFD|nr:glycoside hydrolase family 79 protein [Pseudocercospora fijiensis CIRAD86]EME82186.1 glycoside hydrolase family 79 protein [Pseudocercospora fijiensis CIRAD86]
MLGQTALLGLAIGYAQAVSHTVPSSLPPNASLKLTKAPIGVSTMLGKLSTFDRDMAAVANRRNDSDVDCYVADPKDAPVSVRYGPSFITFADKYKGSVIFGLNRRLNQLENTISAAKNAVANISNLIAIQLANEANLFNSTDPINTNGGKWTASDDISSQTSWQSSVGTALSKTSIFSAGVYFSGKVYCRC